jgi:hypothetical protein
MPLHDHFSRRTSSRQCPGGPAAAVNPVLCAVCRWNHAVACLYSTSGPGRGMAGVDRDHKTGPVTLFTQDTCRSRPDVVPALPGRQPRHERGGPGWPHRALRHKPRLHVAGVRPELRSCRGGRAACAAPLRCAACLFAQHWRHDACVTASAVFFTGQGIARISPAT